MPGADVREAAAEALPFADAAFDAVLSQLVVNFLADAPAGVAEMRRVARPGAVVAACVWDYAEGMTLLRRFWDAALAIDPDGAAARDEGRVMPYCGPGELAALWAGAGLRDVAEHTLEASAHYPDFDALWEPFPLGVAPSGAYVAALAAGAQGRAARGAAGGSRRPARRVHAARAGVVRDRAAPGAG